jgi:hypothetical protein
MFTLFFHYHKSTDRVNDAYQFMPSTSKKMQVGKGV